MRGQRALDGTDGPVGDDHAGESTDQAEQAALEEQLADDAAPVGTECGADDELASTGGGAGEEEIRDVGAGDEQHEAGGGEQREERGTDLPEGPVGEQLHVDGVSRVALRKFFRELLGDVDHIGARPIEGHARLEAADGVEPGMAAAVLIAVGKQTDRDVEIDTGDGEFETRRRDADDGVDFAAQSEFLAEDVRFAGEDPFPESLADQHGAGGARLVFVCAEEPAEQRWHAESRQQVVAEHVARHALRLDGTQIVETLAAESTEGCETLLACAPVLKVRVGHRHVRHLLGILAHEDELLLRRKSERLEQKAVDDAEHRGVSADAEREGEHGDEREARSLGKGAESEF